MNTKLWQIEITDVTKKYGKRTIFEHLNLTITSEYVNLLRGHNGLGKSTLLQCLAGLIKYQGHIEPNYDEMAYCPERFVLPEYILVKELFTLIPLNQRKVEELLKKFSVNPAQRIRSLSKGMHLKILLTLTLAREVDAYFFDEPLNGLDDESIKVFIDALNELHLAGKLLVIATHNPLSFQALKNKTIFLGDYV